MTRSTAPLRLRLAVPAAAVILPLALGAGCSSDDDNPAAPDAREGNGGEQVVDCQAEVVATGDAEADWDGKARVNLRNPDDEGAGPEARYTTEGGSSALSVFSAGPDFDPTITLSVDGIAYSGGADPEGLDAAEDGSGATVDVDLTGPDRASVQLEATITCDEPEEE